LISPQQQANRSWHPLLLQQATPFSTITTSSLYSRVHLRGCAANYSQLLKPYFMNDPSLHFFDISASFSGMEGKRLVTKRKSAFFLLYLGYGYGYGGETASISF
jgi:hypothetical protein